jgi:RNA polymerase primary sigma factor
MGNYGKHCTRYTVSVPRPAECLIGKVRTVALAYPPECLAHGQSTISPEQAKNGKERRRFLPMAEARGLRAAISMMRVQARNSSASSTRGAVPAVRLAPLRDVRALACDEQEPSDVELAALSAAEQEASTDEGAGHAGPHVGAEGSGDAFERYLHDLGSIALLSPDEELRLAKRSMAGDLDARKHLIEANLRLVIATVRRYGRSGVPVSDLVQEGNLGLMRAAERFDWRRGCRFSTYATWWIRQAVRRAVNGQSQLIRVPDRVMDRVRKVRHVATTLAQEAGYDPSPAEIAARSGMQIEEVGKLLHLIEQPLSLDMAGGEDDTRSATETLIDLDTESPEDTAAHHLFGEALSRALGQLTPQERAVLTLRYGLGDGRCRTCGEVSRQLGVSRHRTTQCEMMGLGKLRSALTSWSLHLAV